MRPQLESRAPGMGRYEQAPVGAAGAVSGQQLPALEPQQPAVDGREPAFEGQSAMERQQGVMEAEQEAERYNRNHEPMAAPGYDANQQPAGQTVLAQSQGQSDNAPLGSQAINYQAPLGDQTVHDPPAMGNIAAPPADQREIDGVQHVRDQSAPAAANTDRDVIQLPPGYVGSQGNIQAPPGSADVVQQANNEGNAAAQLTSKLILRVVNRLQDISPTDTSATFYNVSIADISPITFLHSTMCSGKNNGAKALGMLKSLNG